MFVEVLPFYEALYQDLGWVPYELAVIQHMQVTQTIHVTNLESMNLLCSCSVRPVQWVLCLVWTQKASARKMKRG